MSYMTEPAVLHVLHRIADYPVLEALARGRTQANKLDGRACRYIYESALPHNDWRAVTAHEQDFMRALGIAISMKAEG